MHYQDVEEPPKIAKPLKSNDFKECCEDEWDYNFVGDNNDEILALIRASNYLDVKPLLELLSAKVACKIRGTTTESIRKDFGIDNISFIIISEFDSQTFSTIRTVVNIRNFYWFTT